MRSKSTGQEEIESHERNVRGAVSTGFHSASKDGLGLETRQPECKFESQAHCFLRSSSHPSSGKDGVHDRFLLDMKSVAICVVSLQTECRPLKHFSLQTYYN